MAPFDYAKLRNLERKERQSPDLTNISDEFYQSAQEYIQTLENRLEEEHSHTPSSKKSVLISDELRNTQRIWESIFERREKKIVQAALSTARGGSHTPKHLTKKERVFFDHLLTVLHERRRAVFDSSAKPVDDDEQLTNATEEPHEELVENLPPDKLACVEVQEPSTPKNPEGESTELITLRMIQDIPSFMGSDLKKYSLQEDDVVALPSDMADILLERGAAKQVPITWKHISD